MNTSGSGMAKALGGGEKLTSKQRVLTALANRVPDAQAESETGTGTCAAKLPAVPEPVPYRRPASSISVTSGREQNRIRGASRPSMPMPRLTYRLVGPTLYRPRSNRLPWRASVNIAP